MAERGMDGGIKDPNTVNVESMNESGPPYDKALAGRHGINLKPGQYMGDFISSPDGGLIPTTVYNPPASSPFMEQRYGEKKYNPKKDQRNPNALMEKIDALADKVQVMEVKANLTGETLAAKDAEIAELKAKLARGTTRAKTQTRRKPTATK